MANRPKHPDPDHPSRPDHADFWRMSDIVLKLDEGSDNLSALEVPDSELERMGKEQVSMLIERDLETDEDSLTYMATQRGIRVAMMMGAPPQIAAMAGGAWLEGFMVGYLFHEGRIGE